MNKEEDNKKNNKYKKEEKKEIQLDMNEKIAQGAYSNLTLSNVNQEEFIMDFVFLQPHVNKGLIQSRIIMTPKNVKRLIKMLGKQLAEYEKNIGPIDDEPQLPSIDLNFN